MKTVVVPKFVTDARSVLRRIVARFDTTGLRHTPGSLLPDGKADAGALTPSLSRRLMVLRSLPMIGIPGALSAGLTGMVQLVFVTTLWLLAIWVLKQGLLAEREWRANRTAHRPTLPRKRIGMFMATLSLFAGGSYELGPNWAVLPAVVLWGLLSMAFGRDPQRDREGAAHQTDHSFEVHRLSVRAKERCRRIHNLLRRTVPELLPDFALYEATLNRLLTVLATQPEHHSQVSAHLGPELEALEQAAEKLSVVLAASAGDDAVGSYRSTLGKMTSEAKRCLSQLKGMGSRALDLEMGVLGDALARKV
ncbi:hypothetical protein LZA78_12980 [Sinirhodobacter sp. WL0062]|uniref:5-bromo-4-chloroindolyl phosphate hydrolase n=1 Tax=Rhodobacter flavimaris TaxID=2907145 RepID=A0ABS8Z139_9RHOB|nr:hypothetical protein [Sinirhodobacter sp. WL0062]MCE5974396.1 hypothetical protein [Sinirhodobacter sp. WL0062]